MYVPSKWLGPTRAPVRRGFRSSWLRKHSLSPVSLDQSSRDEPKHRQFAAYCLGFFLLLGVAQQQVCDVALLAPLSRAGHLHLSRPCRLLPRRTRPLLQEVSSRPERVHDRRVVCCRRSLIAHHVQIAGVEASTAARTAARRPERTRHMIPAGEGVGRVRNRHAPSLTHTYRPPLQQFQLRKGNTTHEL